ncbi:MAG TPA: hypothetical protein VEA69_18650 [Tepidisphaeraceae bacterium]|nr:hypothetical protein [Tepidisphaeraceae bacterium]
MRLVAFVLMAAVVAFVGPARAAERVELTKNPKLLLKPEFRATKITVHGIGLGDAEKSVPADAIAAQSQENGRGWFIMKEGFFLSTADGKVVAILFSVAAVEKWELGLKTAADVRKAFGKPDETTVPAEHGGKIVEHFYRERGLEVVVTETGIAIKLR